MKDEDSSFFYNLKDDTSAKVRPFEEFKDEHGSGVNTVMKSDKDSEDMSSAISSNEHKDAVMDEPIDVISMRKMLKRQTTICPTYNAPNHV